MDHGEGQICFIYFLKNILNGKKINLFNFGNHIRDFGFCVDDIVEPQQD